MLPAMEQMQTSATIAVCLLTQLCQCALTMPRPSQKGKQHYLQIQFLSSLLSLAGDVGSDNSDAKFNKNTVSEKGY